MPQTTTSNHKQIEAQKFTTICNNDMIIHLN